MSLSVNKATIIGYLGADPDIRVLPSNDRVASFSVATTDRWTDKDQNAQEKTVWHKVQIYNQGLVTLAEKYLHKGSRVYLEGALETRQWTDKDNAEHYSTEIVLRAFRGDITLLDSKPEPEAPTPINRRQSDSKPAPRG
ncbi:MAG: single-stranded DNA-binding protein [Acidobacteriaceae bacterium]